MIRENVTFTCNTIGIEAHWVLNAIPMTISYPDQKQAYEDQGVIFLEDVHQQYYNLTMVVNASLALNNILHSYRFGFHCGNESGDSSYYIE